MHRRLTWPTHHGRARNRQSLRLADARRRRRLRRRNLPPEEVTP